MLARGGVVLAFFGALIVVVALVETYERFKRRRK